MQTLSTQQSEIQSQIEHLADLFLPKGFEKRKKKNEIHYEVPLSVFPDGYHCQKNKPLPFIWLTVNKSKISLHHMGLYARPELMKWLKKTYLNANVKLSTGKSCIHFKDTSEVNEGILKELFEKIELEEWVELYKLSIQKR